MCGLLYSDYVHLDKKDLDSSLMMMKHRGPDNVGSIRTEGVFLGHARLSIIDLDSRSNQPFYTEDGRYAIIYNGEIYNHESLRIEHDIGCKTLSDTEIVLKLFVMYGKDFLSLLNGMFAFVIYDFKEKSVFAARDRLGVKPLYYRESSDGSHTFCSEIAPLCRLFNDFEIDDIGLRQYRATRGFFRQHTIFKNIKEFAPGSVFVDGKWSKYWDFVIFPSQEVNQEDLAELITDAVNIRLVADVNVGTLLSGGLDSSLVTALSCVKETWSIGQRDNNEFEHATVVSDFLGTKHCNVVYDDENFKEDLSKIISKLGVPLSVPNEVLLAALFRRLSSTNTVVLSGEGADELFFGYDRIFSWAATQTTWSVEAFDNLYSYGVEADLEIIDYIIEPHIKKYKKPIEILCSFFQIDHLKGLLNRLDRTSMLYSVEARTPFVDYRLVEYMGRCDFAGRLVYDTEGKNLLVKKILKDIALDYLPKEIVGREKVGFPVTMSSSRETKREKYEFWLNLNLEMHKEVLSKKISKRL